ncbi:DUF1835 domain-containing protein [Halopseudomonas maritima]|uniref:DUF1835 domain-containing protein n=1 Tax=Halopseudomonas maritima TaxID=2918528 RepID=UPI001EEB3675|nr:DUF1835 domain-containing protein [Halopseudomonas maritima]UJJ30922.1 DUF1835 domain-containing protein [Halopseudomonas maritima]
MSTPKAPRRSPSSPVSNGRLNLEQQRKRAKDLLKSLNAGDPDALQRVSQHLPPRSQTLRLADAQLVIAREAGFASWPRLKQHIESISLANQQLQRTGDQDRKTLHIRCGSDIQHSLRTAGLTGDFLEFSDPFCIGPLSDSDPQTLLHERAAFLAQAFNLAPADALGRQQQSYNALLNLAPYQRIVLWLEHDSYDQLILAYLLHRLRELQPGAELQLIAVDQVPGVARFIGIGQLAPEVLSWLWPQRKHIKPDLLRLGSDAWHALTAADPTALLALIKTGTPALPMLGLALHRHLQQLPDLTHGLGLTERLTLQILQREGPMPTGKVFAQLMRQVEPLPYLGDLMFWWLLQPLLNGPTPLLHVDSSEADWPQRVIQLSSQGQAVLQGKADGFSCRPTGYWVGGVALTPGQPHWRYDPGQQRLHLQHA